jgi:hypothetical protein
MRYDPMTRMSYEYEVIEMHKLLSIIAIGLIFAISACGGDDAELLTCPAEPAIEELEARVIGNTYIVRAALEEFMAHNDDLCPYDIYNDTNVLGLTVIDLLPGGQLLENPFTGERTEPVDTLATEPGQTGYSVRSFLCPSLYYINGIGERYTVVELSNVEELKWKGIRNCLTVREAVERFAESNGGIYPDNVGVDTTPEGYTVVEFLPDGCLLENPFTRCATEPTDCFAMLPGETGYVPIVQNLVNAGYTITGCGHIAGFTIFEWEYSPTSICIMIDGETVYCTK